MILVKIVVKIVVFIVGKTVVKIVVKIASSSTSIVSIFDNFSSSRGKEKYLYLRIIYVCQHFLRMIESKIANSEIGKC